MSGAKIIKGPHVLFRGGDGSITAGIRLESARPPEECESMGLSHVWDVNTYTFSCYPKGYVELLGLTEAQHSKLLSEMRAIENPPV